MGDVLEIYHCINKSWAKYKRAPDIPLSFTSETVYHCCPVCGLGIVSPMDAPLAHQHCFDRAMEEYLASQC